jgi:3-dehydroquinate dehydratase-1
MGKTIEQMVKNADFALSLGSDLVELRLDYLQTTSGERILDKLSRLMSSSVITIRPVSEGGRYNGSERDRTNLLLRFQELKPTFIDVELRTLQSNKQLASLSDGNLIVSWHDLKATPSEKGLRAILERAHVYGGIAKIVTKANTTEDNLRVLSLYRKNSNRLIAFCIGEKGLLSRILSVEFGSPIAYTSLPNQSVAPGQIPIQAMLALERRMGHL